MDEPIVDAEIVPSSVPTSSTDSAETILELENMIKTNVAAIDRNKEELKKLREMLESALTNDENYREATEKAKETAKLKGKAKLSVMQNQATKQLSEKVKDLTTEVKESNIALSEYLREYARMSGTSEIEVDDGEVREIIYTAKLVKKSKR